MPPPCTASSPGPKATPTTREELLAAGNGRAGNVLPTGLAALLLARIEQVPANAQQVLRAAAVAGRRVEDDIVREASGLAAADYEEASPGARSPISCWSPTAPRATRSGTH